MKDLPDSAKLAVIFAVAGLLFIVILGRLIAADEEDKRKNETEQIKVCVEAGMQWKVNDNSLGECVK